MTVCERNIETAGLTANDCTECSCVSVVTLQTHTKTKTIQKKTAPCTLLQFVDNIIDTKSFKDPYSFIMERLR